MHSSADDITHVKRNNNFGIIRLVFAILVVVAHAYYLKSECAAHGSFSPKLGTIGLGDLSVDGFFLISGYLISKSLDENSSWTDFFLKRFIRIYPAFAMAYIFSLIFVGQIAGGSFENTYFLSTLGDILLLKPPSIDNAFAGLPHPDLNGSMWTISLEFQCYVMMFLFHIFTSKSNRYYHIIISTCLLFLYLMRWRLDNSVFMYFGWHFPTNFVRLFMIFYVGSNFYIYRDVIRYKSMFSVLALLLLVPTIHVYQIAEPAVAVFGGYFLFWFAFNVPQTIFSKLTDQIDLSYGMYLYSWPMQNLIIYFISDITSLELCGISLAISLVFGLISWHLIERPLLILRKVFFINLALKKFKLHEY